MTVISRSIAVAPILLAAVVASSLFACGDGETREAIPEAAPEAVALAELRGVPYPADNPPSAAKVELGRLLFWDPILSGNGDVSCASCHDPALGYSDGRALSLGTQGQSNPRGALTVLDAAWNGWTALNATPDARQAPMFWDNRARSLEAQARGPLTGATEMRGTAFTETTIFPELVKRLGGIPEYAQKFEAAFGAHPIDETAIVSAIASFERTVVTVPSYQRFLAGDESAISAAAKRGVDAFRRAGCARCHSGPMLSDFQLHRFTQGGEAIRTPSLRNVMRTAPYMHDGRAATLDQVFDIYRRVDQRADPLFRDLRVPRGGQERDDIVAFFQAASDGDYDRSIPARVPSGLTVGGTRRGNGIAAR